MNDEQIKELINRRRRQILVHSFLYYRMDTSLIDDYIFDKWSIELVELQKDYFNIANEGVFSKEFKNFDGSSGFDLPLGDFWIQNKAIYLLRIRKYFE